MVRNAEPRDITEILQIASEMVDESPTYKNLSLDQEILRKNLESFMALDSFLFIVDETDGVITGGFIAECASSWMSADLVAVDHIWFVRKVYRGSSAGVKFLRKYNEWAINKGAKQISLSITFGVEIERIKELANVLGFETVGYDFIKEI